MDWIQNSQFAMKELEIPNTSTSKEKKISVHTGFYGKEEVGTYIFNIQITIITFSHFLFSFCEQTISSRNVVPILHTVILQQL